MEQSTENQAPENENDIILILLKRVVSWRGFKIKYSNKNTQYLEQTFIKSQDLYYVIAYLEVVESNELALASQTSAT